MKVNDATLLKAGFSSIDIQKIKKNTEMLRMLFHVLS